VILAARQLGRVMTLPLDEIRKLSAKRDALLAPERRFPAPIAPSAALVLA
jgi:hypothetical protein